MMPVSSCMLSSTSCPVFPFFFLNVRGSWIVAIVAWMLQSRFGWRSFIFL